MLLCVCSASITQKKVCFIFFFKYRQVYLINIIYLEKHFFYPIKLFIKSIYLTNSHTNVLRYYIAWRNIFLLIK